MKCKVRLTAGAAANASAKEDAATKFLTKATKTKI